VKGWGEVVSTVQYSTVQYSMCGEIYWELCTVLSYLGVVYPLYRLYFKMSCVVCIVVICLVCIVVTCLVCIVVSCVYCC